LRSFIQQNSTFLGSEQATLTCQHKHLEKQSLPAGAANHAKESLISSVLRKFDPVLRLKSPSGKIKIVSTPS
jgi:hypothetical protein